MKDTTHFSSVIKHKAYFFKQGSHLLNYKGQIVLSVRTHWPGHWPLSEFHGHLNKDWL